MSKAPRIEKMLDESVCSTLGLSISGCLWNINISLAHNSEMTFQRLFFAITFSWEPNWLAPSRTTAPISVSKAGESQGSSQQDLCQYLAELTSILFICYKYSFSPSRKSEDSPDSGNLSQTLRKGEAVYFPSRKDSHRAVLLRCRAVGGSQESTIFSPQRFNFVFLF